MKNNIASGSICKIRNRCLVTGKSRSTFKKFRLSRNGFKLCATKGLLTGVLRSKH